MSVFSFTCEGFTRQNSLLCFNTCFYNLTKTTCHSNLPSANFKYFNNQVFTRKIQNLCVATAIIFSYCPSLSLSCYFSLIKRRVLLVVCTRYVNFVVRRIRAYTSRRKKFQQLVYCSHYVGRKHPTLRFQLTLHSIKRERALTRTLRPERRKFHLRSIL